MSFTNEIRLAIRNDVSDGGGSGTPGDPYAVNTPETTQGQTSFPPPVNLPARAIAQYPEQWLTRKASALLERLPPS